MSKVRGPLQSEYDDFKANTWNRWHSGWDYVNANPEIQTVLCMDMAFCYLESGEAKWLTAPVQAARTPHNFSYGNDQGGHLLEMYAVVYDWLYDDLSEDDKSTIRRNIASIADTFLDNYPDEIKIADYHNYMTQWITGFMTAGLAIYHDDPVRGQRYIDFATECLYEGHTFTNVHGETVTWNFRESLDYSDGYADFEGVAYFKNAIPEIAMAVEAWDGATLRQFDMWNTHFSSFRNAADLIVYGHTANNNVVKFEDANPMSTYISSRYMTLLNLMEGRFQDGYLKSFIDEKYPGVLDWQYGGAYKIFSFLFYDPGVTTVEYKTLDPDRHADNYYFMKSGWDTDDTYIGFKAGTHYGYHSHSDHNAFFIWRKGDILTAPGGMYGDGCQTFDDPQKNHTAWNRQSVSSNCITVFDPDDNYIWSTQQGASLPNAGGQRMPYLRKDPPYSHHEDWSYTPWSGYMVRNDATINEVSRYADVTAWEHDSTFAYVRSNATKAYANAYTGLGHNPHNKVDLVEREFVYLKPNVVVIYDRVNTKSPTFTTSFLLHSIGPPEVYNHSSWQTPNVGISDYPAPNRARMDTASSRLFLQTVLPSDNYKYHVIGGEGFENYIEAAATNYAPDCTVEDYNMRWRIEVRPENGQHQNHVFLNVLEISDVNQDEATTSTLLTTNSGNMQGVMIDNGLSNQALLFSSDLEGVGVSGPVSYETPAITTTHYLYNMPPDTRFSLTTTQAGGKTVVTIEQSPSGVLRSSGSGVLSFTTPAPPLALSVTNTSPTLLGGVTVFTATVTISNSNPITYTWHFGDGISGGGVFTGAAVFSHIYPAADVYTAVVTATDGLTLSSKSARVDIVANYPVYLPIIIVAP